MLKNAAVLLRTVYLLTVKRFKSGKTKHVPVLSINAKSVLNTSTKCKQLSKKLLTLLGEGIKDLHWNEII